MVARLTTWFRFERPQQDGLLRVRGSRIYILPTRYGVVFALLLLLILIGAVNFGNNPAFLVTFLLAGVGTNAIYHTWRNLVGVSVKPLGAEPVFAGETASFRFLLNETGGRSRLALQMGCANQNPVAIDLAASASAVLALSIKTSVRGKIKVPRVTIATRYPLGLLHAWCYLETESTGLVYPRPAAAWIPPGIPQHGGSEQGDQGSGTDDFVGLRSYRPGDSPRHMDWRALARERGLLTRQFGGDETERMWLDWDSTPGNGVEERLQRLCRALLDAECDNAHYGLKLPGVQLAPDHGPAHLNTCLRLLARYPEIA